MNRIISNPFAKNLSTAGPGFQVEGIGHAEVERTQGAGYGRAIVRTVLFLLLAVAGVALIITSLAPAVLVMFLMFLPALAPIFLVILGVLAAEEVEVPTTQAEEAGSNPCTCHRDRVGQHVEQHQTV